MTKAFLPGEAAGRTIGWTGGQTLGWTGGQTLDQALGQTLCQALGQTGASAPCRFHPREPDASARRSQGGTRGWFRACVAGRFFDQPRARAMESVVNLRA